MEEKEALSLARKYADENDIQQVIYYYRLVDESLLTEDDWFQYAKSLHEAGDSENALEIINNILILNPEMDRFYSLRAHVKRELELVEEALTDLNKALSINPENYYHWYTRALVYLDLERLEEATYDYLEAIKREEEESVSSTWYELGNVYMQLNDYENAKNAIKKAIGDGSTSIPIYFARLAECYQYTNQLEKAIYWMEQAFEMSIYLYSQPDGGNAFIFKRGKYSNVAIETHTFHMLDRYLYTHPLSILYDQNGEIDKSIDVLGIGLEYFDCAYLLQERAGLLQKKGEKHEALQDLIRATQVEPDNAYAFYLLGSAYQDLGNPQLALINYHKAILLEPDDDYYYYQRGTIYLEQEKLREAQCDFSKAIYFWEDACYYLKRAIVHSKLGLYREALADLMKALEHDDDLHENIEWITAHAGVLYNLGQFEKAHTYVTMGLELEEENGNANEELSTLLILIQISQKNRMSTEE